jgi:hypothetical protein
MSLFSRLHPDLERVEAPVDPDVAVLRAVLRHYPDGAQLHFGVPTRCPGCGDFGFVEDVDVHLGVCTNRCLSCSRTWAITVDALRAQSGPDSTAPMVMVSR